MNQKVFEAGSAVVVVFRDGDEFSIGISVYRDCKEVSIYTPHELRCLRSALDEAMAYITREGSFIERPSFRRFH